eukprot:230795-Prorocentrum_minimum.AAC.1
MYHYGMGVTDPWMLGSTVDEDGRRVCTCSSHCFLPPLAGEDGIWRRLACFGPESFCALLH